MEQWDTTSQKRLYLKMYKNNKELFLAFYEDILIKKTADISCFFERRNLMNSVAHALLITRIEKYAAEHFSKRNQKNIGFRIQKQTDFFQSLEHQADFSDTVTLYFRTSKREILGEEKEQLLALLQETRPLHIVYYRFKNVILKENPELFTKSANFYTNIIEIAGFIIFFLFLTFGFPYFFQ